MEENVSLEKPSVLSVGLKFGLIIAVASIAFMMITIALGSNPFERDWKGWISSLVTIAIVVFAHKNFKDSGDGFMSYGQGLGIGFISVMTSVLIVMAFNLIYVNFIDADLMEDLWRKTEEQMAAQGQNEQNIATAIEWTKKIILDYLFHRRGIYCISHRIDRFYFYSKEKSGSIR